MADKKVELNRKEVQLLTKVFNDYLSEQVRIVSKLKGYQNVRTINDLEKVDGDYASFRIPLLHKLRDLEYQVPDID